MKSLCLIACLGLLAAIAPAQTVGVPGANDFVVNGNGSGASSCVNTTVFNNLDFSLSVAPGAVLLGAFATGCGPAAPIGAATGTFDLNGIGLGFWIDGTNSVGAGNPLNQFATADATGAWSFSASASGLPPATSLGAFQFAVIGAAYGPTGFDVTQAHALTTPIFGCTPLANTAVLGDDQSMLVSFSAGSFGFYGASYSDVFIASNGRLTFTAADNNTFPTAATFLSGAPRICPLAADFNPSTMGTVSYSEAGGIFSVSWNDVPTFASFGTDANSFCATLDLASGAITTTISQADLFANGVNAIVGISPGNSASAALSIDLSASVPFASPGAMDAIFEEFMPGVSTYDIQQTQFTWAPAGPGVGPYTVF